MNAQEIYAEATRRGFEIFRRGDMLVVRPSNLLTREFADEIRKHKGEILNWLEARASNLTPDRAPRLHTARQILEGEFDGADRSTCESLTSDLTNHPYHPICQRALERLKTMQPDT